MPGTVTYPVGSLVTARGREWLVLPESRQPELLILRPLGATDEEITGILPELEPVDIGDFRAARPSDGGRLRVVPVCSVTRCGSASAPLPARSARSVASP